MHRDALLAKFGQKGRIDLDEPGFASVVETGVELRRDDDRSDREADHGDIGRIRQAAARCSAEKARPGNLDEARGSERRRIETPRMNHHRGRRIAVGECDGEAGEDVGSDPTALSARRRRERAHVLGLEDAVRAAEWAAKFDRCARIQAVGLRIDCAEARPGINQKPAAPTADCERRERRSAGRDVERNADIRAGHASRVRACRARARSENAGGKADERQSSGKTDAGGGAPQGRNSSPTIARALWAFMARRP